MAILTKNRRGRFFFNIYGSCLLNINLRVFKKIALKAGRRRAIVAIARRLVGRIRSCVLNGTFYEIELPEENKKESIKETFDKEQEEVPVCVTSSPPLWSEVNN